jgi:hypothetical protein
MFCQNRKNLNSFLDNIFLRILVACVREKEIVVMNKKTSLNTQVFVTSAFCIWDYVRSVSSEPLLFYSYIKNPLEIPLTNKLVSINRYKGV